MHYGKGLAAVFKVEATDNTAKVFELAKSMYCPEASSLKTNAKRLVSNGEDTGTTIGQMFPRQGRKIYILKLV